MAEPNRFTDPEDLAMRNQSLDDKNYSDYDDRLNFYHGRPSRHGGSLLPLVSGRPLKRFSNYYAAAKGKKTPTFA